MFKWVNFCYTRQMKLLKFNFVKAPPKDKSAARVALAPKKESEVLLLPTGQKQIVVGVSEYKKVTRRALILLFRKVISLAKQNRIKKLALDLEDFDFKHLKLEMRDLAEIAAAAFEMANFEFVKYKTKPSDGWNFVEQIFIAGAENKEAREGFRRGQLIAGEVNEMRELANTPGVEMTPEKLAAAARATAHGTRIKVKVLGVREMQKLGMGGIVNVGKGSDAPPRFIIMEYYAGPKSQRPVVLVGKGITFDSGGINLKPWQSMEDMHMDMSGAAAVIHALRAAARLGVKKNIVALVPAAENMPSGKSYRMHDIIRTMGGKTVEIGHTDAEGRVVLADALEYSKRYEPALVIDVATLTGAAMSALGQRALAIFSTEEKLEKLFRDLGEKSGDYVWPLPLWEEYEDMVKGTFADVTNSGKSKYGGAIEGAMFLWQFVKEKDRAASWVHIDMAPRMTAIDGEHLAKGSSGSPMRLLVKLLETW